MVGSTPTRFRQGWVQVELGTRKSRPDSVASEARRRARERAGMPPGSRVITDKRKKPPKHKKAHLENELA